MALLDGSIDTQRLNRLVQISHSIVVADLTARWSSINRLSRESGLSIEDLAMDCMGSLFDRDEFGTFRLFVKFIEKLREPLDGISDHHLFLAYLAFVRKISGGRISRIYSEFDPTGAKISRNIKQAVQKSDILVLDEDFRGTILKPQKQDSLDELPEYPLADMEAALTTAGEFRIPALIRKLAESLITQDSYRRSVPLQEVVILFKKVFAVSLPTDEDNLFPSLEGLEQNDLDIIEREAYILADRSIASVYYFTGKIERSEAEVLSKTLKSIIAERFSSDGQERRPYFEHLNQFREMSEKEYEFLWRPRIEYITKILIQFIRNSLQGNF